MRLRRFGFAVSAAALAAAAPAHAGYKVLFGPPPDWVVAHPPAAEPARSGDLPVEIVQLDHQVRFEGDAQTTYAAMSLKFLKPEGLQAGNLTFSWDPETEDLTVNRVLIHRGDKTIDVLGEGQAFTILRREQDLEQATLTGMLTASLIPEGLQVGDVLESVSTRVSRNPVTGTHAEDVLGPLNVPAGRIDASVEWPQGKAIRLAETADLPPWLRTRKDGFERAALSLENVEPIIPPSSAPARYAVTRMAEATDYGSWGEVANLFVPLYQKASKIPAAGPLRVELEKIRASAADPVKRAEGALQLVESRIRYVALEMGTGGLIPADAADTWARRFGDCKAKTALLLGLLHELGIDSEPVVVNAGFGDLLSDRLPAVGMFNHILVRARIGGKTYWLDGTRTGDTRLSQLPVPNFGWGLPIRKDAAALVRILPPPLEQPDSDMAIELDATNGIRAPVPAKLELTLRGDDALGTNQVLASLTGNTRDEALRKFWRNRFDFIEPQTYDLAFDPDKAELRLTMQGTATMDWKDGWYETDETGVGYRPDFSRAAGPGHDAPFAVSYPFFVRTRETILLPPTFTAKVSSDASEVDETIAGIEYHRHASLTGNRFVIERTSRSLVPEIAYKEATAAAKRLRELSQSSVYLRIPNSYRLTEADLAAVSDLPGHDSTELVAQGAVLLTNGKYDEALAKFTQATELDPQSGGAWASRAFAESWIGSLDDAERSLARAEKLDPANVMTLNASGNLNGKHGKFQAALDDFDAVLAIDPGNSFAASRRASALAGLGRFDDALKAVSDQIKEHPQQSEAYPIKFGLLMQRGDRAAALATADALVQAKPGDPFAQMAAAQMYTQLGLRDKAQPLVDKLVSSRPTPQALVAKAQARDSDDKAGKLADLDAALRLDPKFAPALAMRAVLRSAAGENDTALADIDAAIAASPKSLELYLQKANVLRNLGRRDEALKVASDMAAASPQETYAHVAAAKIYDAFGERSQALAEIDRALAIRPEAYIYLNRSQVLPADDLDGRLADVEKALKLGPDLPEALAMKADLLTRKGDNAAAVELLTDLVEKQPDEASYLDRLGLALWREGKHDAAERNFAAAGKLATDAGDLNNLCYQKAMAGVALELALEQCRKALQLQPGAAHILDSRGAVYLRMGRYKEANDDFDSALVKSPQLVPSLIRRAIVRLHFGDTAGARADVAAALKIDSAALDRYRADGFAVPSELIQIASSH